jgi:hypothetical protein
VRARTELCRQIAQDARYVGVSPRRAPQERTMTRNPARTALATVAATLLAAVLVAPAAQAAAPVTLMPKLAFPGETAAPEQPSRGCGLLGCRPAK